ncbi:MAG: hypothetical protein KGO96_13135 [Elusimicrobia bacterium]|nr:hypothetical protein [Elusimicrobiota bacterium]
MRCEWGLTGGLVQDIGVTPTLNAWHQFICTFNALTDQEQIYEDGSLIASATQGSGIKYSAANNHIYFLAIPPWNSLGGREAFAFVISRVLSASEVSELYASTPPNLENQITTGGNTYTFNFYKTGATTLDYSGSVAGFTPASTFNVIGTSQSQSLTTSPQTFWLDYSPYTFNDHYVSATERWSQNNNGTYAGASSITAAYVDQFDQPTKIAYPDGGSTSIALTCTQYGSNVALTLLTTTQHDWADKSGSCTVPATTSISAGNSRLSMGTTYSWSITATGIVPATLDGYLQDHATPEAGITGLAGTANGTAATQNSGGYFDAATTVTATGTSSCAYTLSAPAYVYQFGGSAVQAWLNTTGSAFTDGTSQTPPQVTFSATKVTADLCTGSLTYTGASVTDNGVAVASAFASPSLTFSGSSAFVVTFTTQGSSSQGQPPNPPPVATTTTTASSQAAGGFIPPGLFTIAMALLLIVLAALYVLSRSTGKGDDSLNEALKEQMQAFQVDLDITGKNKKKRKKK